MQPKTDKVLSEARLLADLTEDDEYIIFMEDMPVQMMSKADAEMLQATAETIDTFMKGGFVVTFILNLALKGVMSQLWSIFNTLQIILALPLLSVVMPANVLEVQAVIN